MKTILMSVHSQASLFFDAFQMNLNLFKMHRRTNDVPNHFKSYTVDGAAKGCRIEAEGTVLW